MKTHLATVAAACIALLAGTTLTAQEISAAPATAAAPASSPNVAASQNSQSTDSAGASKVRIVRLSQIKGAVQLDRNTGQGFESGFPNLPIVEGAKLKTGDGFAEVEFEDDSTLRLAPNSLVTFPRLELLPSGAKASTVEVVQGTVYLSRANTKGDQFELAFANQTAFPQPSSHIRLEMQSPKAELAVLSGDVQLQGDDGATEVGKKKTVTFDLADQNQPTLAKNVAENENDAWDQSSLEYHKQYASNSGAYGNTPYLYGLTDLNYYGDFADLGAAGRCGGRTLWAPPGVPSTMVCGPGIRAWATPGSLLIPGAGCPSTMELGISAPALAGVGSPAAPGSESTTAASTQSRAASHSFRFARLRIPRFREQGPLRWSTARRFLSRDSASTTTLSSATTPLDWEYRAAIWDR